MKARDKGIRAIGQHVHDETMRRMSEGEGDYWACFRATLDADENLKCIYCGLKPASVTRGPEIKPKPSEAKSESRAAGTTLHELTVQFMKQTGCEDYAWSLRQILKANKDLARKYTQT